LATTGLGLEINFKRFLIFPDLSHFPFNATWKKNTKKYVEKASRIFGLTRGSSVDEELIGAKPFNLGSQLRTLQIL